MIHVLFASGNFFAVAKSRQGNNHSNRMRKSLLVSFWCLLLSNCLALKAAGVATPKLSAWPPIEAFGAGADGPTLNLFVAEPESARDNGEHARRS